MSAAFPGEKQCDPAAQVKGKCMITSPWEVRLLCPRVGELVQSHCSGAGKPLCFLACLVLLEPCLGFVYRDVFCLTKY